VRGISQTVLILILGNSASELGGAWGVVSLRLAWFSAVSRFLVPGTFSWSYNRSHLLGLRNRFLVVIPFSGRNTVFWS